MVAQPALAAPAWRPLLGGPAGSLALERVRAIAAGMQRAAEVPAPEMALRALFLAACERAFPGRGHRRAADLALERAVAMLDEEPLPPRLHGGVLTVAWVMGQLSPAGDRLCRPIDEALGDELAAWAGDSDLIFGLAGAGVYALARGLPALVSTVLERLEARATAIEGGGSAWYTPPDWMLAEQRAATPLGHYNAGVAHGAAGIAGFAARALARGIDRARAERIVRGAVGWLDSIALDGEARFPCWIAGAPGYQQASASRPARSAWCYGDPGVAAQLWAAGAATGTSSWQTRAIELARGALARPAAGARLGRHGLCHGAAGFAHILNRLGQASGDVALEDGARTWYARALQLPPDNPSFLTGACGVGLALLAAAHEAPPAWDALLLLD